MSRGLRLLNAGALVLSFAALPLVVAPTAAEAITTTCTGSVTSTDGLYTVVKFVTAETCTWTPPADNLSVQYLVVAGGGGGGVGGGGGGGLLAGTVSLGAASAQTITVGAGGVGGSTGPKLNSGSTNGGNSSALGVTATGGGGGGGYNSVGSAGGSGGGGGGDRVSGGGAGTSGQGNNGGSAPSSGYAAGGGGGGAGTAGGNSTPLGSGAPIIGGVGGDGVASTITGSSVYYAGGGGGGVEGTVVRSGSGPGGLGGGGNGMTYRGATAGNGTANTGGGGGGAENQSGPGGNGGSGVVIVRYLTPYVPPVCAAGSGSGSNWSLMDSSTCTPGATNDAGDGTVQYVKLHASQAGTITAVKTYRREAQPWGSSNGTIKIRVVRDNSPTFTTLAEVTQTRSGSSSAPGWQTFSLGSPVSISAGQDFWLGVYVYYTSQYWNSSYPSTTVGPLSVIGTEGLQNAGFVAPDLRSPYWAPSANPTNAWVDLVFDTTPVVTVPDAPTAVSATATDGFATVSFTPPANNGGATITAYQVFSNPGGIMATGTGSPVGISGLTNGTAYTFTVKAVNSAGSSSASSASAAVTPSAPSSGGTGGSASYSPIPTTSATPTHSATATPSVSATATVSASSTPVPSAITTTSAPSPSASASVSASVTRSASPTPTVSASASPSMSATASSTASASATPSPSSSSTAVVADPGTGSTSDGGPAAPVEIPAGGLFAGQSSGPQVSMSVGVQVGQRVGGSPVSAHGTNLQPGAVVDVTVFSEPRVIAHATADASGTVDVTGALPDDLPAGAHTVVFSSVGANGQPVQYMAGIEVSEDGIATAVAPPAASSGVAPDGAQMQRALAAGKPIYSVADNPVAVAAVATAGAAVVAVASAAGAAAAAGGAAGGGAAGSSGGHAGSGGVGERSSGHGAEGGVHEGEHAHAHAFNPKAQAAVRRERSALGDRSRTWRMPLTAEIETMVAAAVASTGRFSQILPRALADGTWARAILGSGSQLLWLLGIVLGALSLGQSGFHVYPVNVALLLAIMALGILDVMAGLLAWATIVIGALLTGHVMSTEDVRTAVGIGGISISLAFLANYMRPLRRVPGGGALYVFDRIADYLIPTVVIAFGAAGMANGLNALSGLTLITHEQTIAVEMVAGLAIVARLALEDIAIHLYPERCAAVAVTPTVHPSIAWRIAAIIARSALTLLVLAAFVGMTPMAMLITALLALPLVLRIWSERMPNSAAMRRFLPRGLLKVTLTTIAGVLIAAWIFKSAELSARTPWILGLLLVPSALLSVLDTFGRSGGDWTNVWPKRIAGLAVWGLLVAILSGALVLA